MKRILICGAGGFIGSSLAKKLKQNNESYYIVGVDIQSPMFERTYCDKFIHADLREVSNVINILKSNRFDEIYQFAADMGGAGYVFTGDNDADIMHNSAQINLNFLDVLTKINYQGKIFYSSSACIYPEYNQMDPNNPKCEEDSAYPAQPDSEYGWEKLFSERLYFSYHKNKNTNIHVARYHNIYGPYGVFNTGKEKAPAALCRKIITAKIANLDSIDIWGDGEQTRSFLYIDDCLDATLTLVQSNKMGPYNIGSEEMVTINQLAKYIMEFDNLNLKINHISGPEGVRGRNSDNKLIKQDLNWQPKYDLKTGLEFTYKWIYEEIKKRI